MVDCSENFVGMDVSQNRHAVATASGIAPYAPTDMRRDGLAWDKLAVCCFLTHKGVQKPSP